MNSTKQTFVTAFALFSLFFGAGNLILPPYLGFNGGDQWLWVALGFAISAVVIPILAIYGHARLQGTMLDFANKVSPVFAIVYAIIVYLISIALPSPRTASVTYEMAIQPYFEIHSLWISAGYFILVFIFVMNRTKILSLIGKFLTPLIIIILLAIIGIGLFGDATVIEPSCFSNPLTEGVLEGYQTFDAIGGVVVGGVIVISYALQGTFNYETKRKMIGRAGLYAGVGLFVIYAGLIALGAYYSGAIPTGGRSEYLTLLSIETLGKIGTSFLAVLVGLACFTTAVGIVAGTSDFVKGLFGGDQSAYTMTAIVGCILGVLIGQMDIHSIIHFAIPALRFIYPITIVLIILNVIPNKFASPTVFRWVVLLTFVFSIPDFIIALGFKGNVETARNLLPLGKQQLAWVLPSLLTFVISNLVFSMRKESEN